MHEHEKELISLGDKVTILFSEVMFDKSRNISGHNNEIIAFIYDKKKVFEEWGYEVNILRAERDFLDVFYHKLGSRTKDPSRIGLTYGFPLSGRCAVKRDCKLAPIEKWKKANMSKFDIEYIGIATDEPNRLQTMHKEGQVSLLERYNLTEEDAKKLCEKYDMLSPQYSLNDGKQKRDGCWFCPNAKLCEHKEIKTKMPSVWEKYVSLEDTPNLSLPHWNPYSKETLHERDKRLDSLL